VISTRTTRFLHVANGTSTTRTIEAAGLPGVTSIWADPLYEGPVPGGATDDELVDVRMQFLRELTGEAPAPGGAETALDPPHDLRAWRTAIAGHDGYDELVLWFEHDLFDQLNLVQVLPWIDEHVPARKPVSLVCIGSFPGRPHFKGLGELTPRELAPLLDERQPITAAQHELARRAWDAFREPAPEALDAIREEDTSALPYLSAALTRFLQDYPWTTDGLSRTERRLLHLAADDGIQLRDAFPQIHQDEGAYYVTDLSLVNLAAALASTSPPLLTLDGPADGDSRPLRGTVRLTDPGRAVLEGRADRIAACGIDRWMGGVRLQGRSVAWRWADTAGRIVRT
jgi:hypothetical protein